MIAAPSVNKVVSILSAIVLITVATPSAYADYYTSAEPDTFSPRSASRYHCVAIKHHKYKHYKHHKRSTCKTYSKRNTASIEIYYIWPTCSSCSSCSSCDEQYTETTMVNHDRCGYREERVRYRDTYDNVTTTYEPDWDNRTGDDRLSDIGDDI